MSADLRQLRESSTEPQAKLLNSIAKRLSQFLTKDQIDQLGDKEDIYSDGRDLETVLRYNNGLLSATKFDPAITYYPPFEPDGQYVTCWIKGVNLGNTTGDLSGFGNGATIYGDPVLVDGYPFDPGIKTDGIKSFGVRYNRPTSKYENEEHLVIPNSDGLKITGISTGITFMVRVRIKSFDEQGGVESTIFHKADDLTPNNAYMLKIDSTGHLLLYLKIGGVEYKKITENSISTDDVYTIFVTYDAFDNTVHIYTKREPDGVETDHILNNTTSSAGWETADLNLTLFKKGASNDGHVYGDFFDFLLYREKVLTSTEIGHYFTNKWTIENYAFGTVMVTNYYAVQGIDPIGGGGAGGVCAFESNSFATDSFEVCTSTTPPSTSFTSTSFTSTSFTE